MESRTHPIGGIAVLTWKGQRIAYLQRHSDAWRLFELWNTPIWVGMIGGRDPIQALRDEARVGSLRMFRLLKSPTGAILVRDFDPSSITFEAE